VSCQLACQLGTGKLGNGKLRIRGQSTFLTRQEFGAWQSWAVGMPQVLPAFAPSALGPLRPPWQAEGASGNQWKS
jgi:hypothetical protein